MNARPDSARADDFVLVYGDHRHPEFQAPLADLHQAGRVRAREDLADAIGLLASGRARAVIVAQARPGQVSPEEVEQLHRASPITPLLALLGSWCEGEMRSGHPWPGAPRVYWHQWTSQLAQIGRRNSPWMPPRPASFADQVNRGKANSPTRLRGLVGVSAATMCDFESLRDMLALEGYAAVWLTDPTSQLFGLRALVWDCSAWNGAEKADIRRAAERLRHAPLVLLLCAPREQDIAEARGWGAKRVVSKPFLVRQLFDALDQALALQSSADAA